MGPARLGTVSVRACSCASVVARGLTKKAWAIIRSDPGLAKLPLTGGALALVAFVVLGVPGGLLVESDSTGAIIGGIVLLAMAAYLAAFTVFTSTSFSRPPQIR